MMLSQTYRARCARTVPDTPARQGVPVCPIGGHWAHSWHAPETGGESGTLRGGFEHGSSIITRVFRVEEGVGHVPSPPMSDEQAHRVAQVPHVGLPRVEPPQAASEPAPSDPHSCHLEGAGSC